MRKDLTSEIASVAYRGDMFIEMLFTPETKLSGAIYIKNIGLKAAKVFYSTQPIDVWKYESNA